MAGIFVLSIPYANGWSITIDGKERPVFSANLGMLATDIEAGAHRIELRYSLPGFLTGLLIGALGIIVLIAPAVFRRRAVSGRS